MLRSGAAATSWPRRAHGSPSGPDGARNFCSNQTCTTDSQSETKVIAPTVHHTARRRARSSPRATTWRGPAR
eukprot:8537620-Pyramimonas_sp.AAC.1